MKVKPTQPTNSTTAKNYRRLRDDYPKHNVLDRVQTATLIHSLRFDNGGLSWVRVAEALNENKVIHSQWRREDPQWDGALVCQFARRYNVVTQRIWRQSDVPQTTFDLDGTKELTEELSQGVVPPNTEVSVTFKAHGEQFRIEGEWSQEDTESAPTISFQYNGVPDPHFLRFLQERGLLTTVSS